MSQSHSMLKNDAILITNYQVCQTVYCDLTFNLVFFLYVNYAQWSL